MEGMRYFHQNSQSVPATQRCYSLKAEIMPMNLDFARLRFSLWVRIGSQKNPSILPLQEEEASLQRYKYSDDYVFKGTCYFALLDASFCSIKRLCLLQIFF